MIDVLPSDASSGSATLTILDSRAKTRRDCLEAGQLVGGRLCCSDRVPSGHQLRGGSTWHRGGSLRKPGDPDKTPVCFCGPSSRRVALQMNLKEQGVQIRTLIMRNDESVLCLRCPSRDWQIETTSQGRDSQVFDVIIMWGIRMKS